MDKKKKSTSKKCQSKETFSIRFGFWKDSPHDFSYTHHLEYFSVPRPQAITARRGQNVTKIYIDKLEEEDKWNRIYYGIGGRIPLTSGQYRAGCGRKANRSAAASITWKL